MQRILLLLIVLHITAYVSWGQAALKVMPSATVNLRNGAKMVINSASLKNDGTLQISKDQGTVTFRGTNDTIGGNGTLLFDTLNVQMASGGTLTLDRNMKVATSIYFFSGLLDLGSNMVDLDSTGMVQGETEATRAYTNGTGYLQANKYLNAPNEANLGNLGLFITTGLNLGYTTVKRGHKAQPNLGQGSSIKRYFDVTPTNNQSLKANVRFSYFDAEVAGMHESDFALWRSANTSWTVLGTNSRDTITNLVQKDNIQTFTRFTLAPGCPTIQVSIPDVYAVQPSGAANTIYIGYGPTSLALTATVSGGVGPYNYRWKTASGTLLGTSAILTVSPTVSTTYYLTVDDQFGCSSTEVSKTINVMDIRCGTNLTSVTVCEKQKSGTYKTMCVTGDKVAGILAISGNYLGGCQTTTPLVTNQRLTDQVQVEPPTAFTASARPNPSSNQFTLTTQSTSGERITIQVLDLLGRNVEGRTGVPANSDVQLGSLYRPGVYVVQIIQGKQVITMKLIKQ